SLFLHNFYNYNLYSKSKWTYKKRYKKSYFVNMPTKEKMLYLDLFNYNIEFLKDSLNKCISPLIESIYISHPNLDEGVFELLSKYENLKNIHILSRNLESVTQSLKSVTKLQSIFLELDSLLY